MGSGAAALPRGLRGPALPALARRAAAALALAASLAACAAHGTVTARSRPAVSLAALRAGLAPGASGPQYYLSLGDSLSQGIQPLPEGGDGPTASGYPDQLAAMLRRHLPALRLVKLGCSGETTQTMRHGGICRYPAGSQLAQAVAFLRQHRGHVALVTLDIGANDPNSCVLRATSVATMPRCLTARISSTLSNLDEILSRLRAAAGPDVLIAAMTYYVPELALWRDGQTGGEIAVLSEHLAAGLNSLLAQEYRKYGARVAKVFAAFRSSDFAGATRRADRPGPGGKLPPNVAAVCELTWMCAPPPRGPNEHANKAGYRVIARAFWRVITG